MKIDFNNDEGLTRRNFIKGGAGVAIAASLFPVVEFHSLGLARIDQQAAAKKTYICPPCGQACDKLTFDSPGNCPQCGMKLISANGEKDADSAPAVAVLLFDSAEIIDFSGPWEVFGGAGFRVFSVAEKPNSITSVYGQKITTDYTFENAPKADVLLVPGGGVRGAVENPTLIKWVQDKAKESTYVMSVCTGAFILAKAGLLDGLSATTVSGGIDALAAAGNKIRVVYDKRYVDNGKIITTAGLSSGIDGAFYLVSKILGKGTAQLTALGIEYDWDPEGKYVRAALADRYLPDGSRFLRPYLNGTDAQLITHEGGMDHWETRLLLSDPKSPAEIIEALSKRIKTNTQHIRGSVTIGEPNTSASSTQIKWNFIDEKGVGWRGLAVAAPGDKGKFALNVKLAHAG